MKRKTRRFILISVIFCLGLAALLLFGGESMSRNVSAIAFIIMAAVLLARNIEKDGIRELILGAGPFLLSGLSLLSNMEFVSHLTNFFNGIADYWRLNVTVTDQDSLRLAFWILFAVLYTAGPPIANRLFDNTAMGRERGKTDPEFRELTFRERNKKFCVTLRHRLERLNRETDWNESAYVPVEAEVEAVIGNTRKKRYPDMIRRLKENQKKDTVYLVLGNPGSGKSVSLRKLCLELLDEAEETKRTPVYLNLKGWNMEWNAEKRPTLNDLLIFVKQQVYGEGDHFSDSFLNDYYDKMLDYGKFYFIFDSFDEMPCLMGGGNCDELIDHISGLIYDFLTESGQCGGIIASRLYNAPSKSLRATETLKIQEFDEGRIRSLLRQYLKTTEDVERVLFGERRDLLTLCRNPFYLTLLIHYLEQENRTFPENQKALYENFIRGRLSGCKGRIRQEGSTEEEVHRAARELALYMHQSHIYGLECPVDTLLSQPGKREYWNRTLKMLEYSRLCRRGVPEGRISFVHRRFQEYFLVENMLDGRLPVGTAEYADILENAGLRDALVLYSEVAEPDTAKEIARYCYDAVRENLGSGENAMTEGGRKLVNALYFLTEAFRNRLDAIAEFQTEFQDLITLGLEDKDADFIVQLAMVRSMALFEEEERIKRVLTVFQHDNRWLTDEAVSNCYTSKVITYEVERKLIQHFAGLDRYGFHPFVFMKHFRIVRFSLSLSSAFRYIRFRHLLTMVEISFMLILHIGLLPLLFLGYVFPAFIDESFLSDLSLPPLLVVTMIIIIPFLTWYLFPIILSWISDMIDSVHGLVVHKVYYPVTAGFKKIWKEFTYALSTFLMMGLGSIIIMIISAIAKISDFFLSIFLMGVSITCFFIVMLGFCLIIASAIFTIKGIGKDYFMLVSAHRYPPSNMDRQQLQQRLDSFHSYRSGRRYLQILFDYKTKFYGDWPDGHRPKPADATADRLLAMLDAASMDSYNYRF